MSTLAVSVVVAGSPGAGLTVAAYKASLFPTNPQRRHTAPNSAPDGSGITDGTGAVTLSGLSAVAYNLVIVDARGVPNWFPVSAAYVGGSYTAVINWTTPPHTTSPVSSGGDTPGGPLLRAAWAQKNHRHDNNEVVSAGGLSQVQGTITGIAVGNPGHWYLRGINLSAPGVAPGGNMFTQDGGLTWSTINAGIIADLAASGSLAVLIDGTGSHYTTDGGNTWSFATGFPTASGTAQGICIVGSTWFITDGATIYSTSNHGASWTLVATLFGNNSHPLSIRSNGQTIVCISSTIVASYVAESNDGGVTWATPNVSFAFFTAGQQGLAVGQNIFVYGTNSGIAGGTSATNPTGILTTQTADAVAISSDDQWLLIGTSGVANNAGYARFTDSAAAPAIGGVNWFTPDPFNLSTADLGACNAIAVDGQRWIYGGKRA